MPTKEEGIREMPGESSGRPREPEQGPHRGAQDAQGALLPQGEERNVVLTVTLSSSSSSISLDDICTHSSSKTGHHPHDYFGYNGLSCSSLWNSCLSQVILVVLGNPVASPR